MGVAMSDSTPIFKKPPAKEVQMGVQFRNSLQIADARARFHNLVKDRFPAVIMPEKDKLAYDFADFSLFTENFAERLEISINYFRFVTTTYAGFASFEAAFLDSLQKFVECYGLESFTHFGLRYQNDLPLPEGKNFDDCFTLKVVMPSQIPFNSYAGRGLLLFEEPEGYVIVEIEPQVEADKIKAYSVNLSFAAQKTILLKDLPILIHRGHEYMRIFFFGILEEPYAEFLRGQNS